MADPALFFNTATGRSTRFGSGDTMQVNTVEAFSATDSVSLFGNLTTGGGALSIGSSDITVTIPGNLTVAGTELVSSDETVTGNFIVNGNTTLGSDSIDTIDAKALVASDLTFKTSTAARSITGDGTNDLTVTAGAGTALTLTSPTAATWSTTAGALSLDGAGGVNIAGNSSEIDLTTSGAIDLNATAAAITLDAAGASNFTTTSGGMTVQGVGLTLEAGTGAFTLDGDAASTITVTGSTLGLVTTGANNINLSPGAGIVNVATTHANQAMALDTTGSTAAAGVFVADAAPSGAVDDGSLWIQTGAGASTGLYQYNGTEWNQFTTSAGSTLQNAYVAGNTINTSATEGNVIISGTELLQVTATGGIDLNTQLDFDGTVFDVQMTGTNGFSIDGTAASNVTVDAGTLTLSTTTSGNVEITPVATADAVITTSGAGGTVDINSGAGGVTIDATAGTIALKTTTSGDITADAADGISLDAGAASNFTTSAGALTLTSAAAATWSTAAGLLTLNGAGGVTVTSTGGTLKLDGTGQTVDLNATTLDVDGGDMDFDGTAFNVGAAGAVPTGFAATTYDLQATGAITIDSSGGAIGIGTDADAHAINIGTGAAARTITVGNATGATALNLDSGTGGISLTSTSSDITLQAATAGDIDLTSEVDITFDARGATNPIPINSAADPDLDTTAQNIVGAINELNAASSDVTVTVTAGEALTKGDLVYLDTADNSEAKKADKDTAATSVLLGACVADIADTATGDVALIGEVPVNTDLSGATVGDVVYLSGTAGEVTTTVPTTGTFLRVGIVTVAATVVGGAAIALRPGDPVGL